MIGGYKFHRFSLDNYVHGFFNEIDNKKSLSLYCLFKRSSFREEYMFAINDFESARLKFMARTGCLGIQENLHTWNIAPSGTCVLCKNGIENVSHFLLTCPAFNETRIRFGMNLKQNKLSLTTCIFGNTLLALLLLQNFVYSSETL